jgi:predicted metal-binding membrane protein
MLLLVAGGVMNVLVIVVLTAFVAFEKLVPLGRPGARISGAFMLAAGCWMLVR